MSEPDVRQICFENRRLDAELNRLRMAEQATEVLENHALRDSD